VQAKIDQLLIWWLETRCKKDDKSASENCIFGESDEVFSKVPKEAACIVGEINILKGIF